MTETRSILAAGGTSVTALAYLAGTQALATLVLAHGAGSHQSSDFMVGFASGLAARGLDVVTFNFPFTERGRKLPDPQPVLEECYRAVLADVSGDRRLGRRPLFIGGKSLGGRMATHLAASLAIDAGSASTWPTRLRGLVLLGYPLHPPGRAQQVRVSHLPAITHPMLFVQGAKDAFGTPAELQTFVNVLPAPCEIYAVDQGGHSFDVPKRSGIPQDAVYAAIQDRIVDWIRALVAA
ncbi:MAG: alpha/beta fold hydrolase [Acidobacteria bacterium]|nr:alpha/beta fold hydrolase [Acidobacteriota bacterium]